MLKISIKKIFWFLIPLLLIVPEYFLVFSFLKNAFLLGKAVSFIFLLSYIIIGKKKMSIYNILLTALMSIIFFSTIINSGNINRIVSVMCSVLALSYYIEIMAKKDPKTMIDSFCCVLGIYIVINFFLMIIYPDGMYVPASWEEMDGDFFSQANWLLGFKNHHVRYFFPMLYFLILKKYNNYYKSSFKMKFSLVFFIVVIGCSALIGQSGTVLGGYVLFGLMYILSFLVRKNYIRIRTITLSVLLGFVALLIWGNSSVVLNIVEFLFGKSYTFGERLLVWSNAISSILSNPQLLLFGHGKLQNIESIRILGFNNTHNSLLEIVYQGGITCFILFVCTLILVSKKNVNTYRTKYGLLNGAMLLSILAMMQVETMYFDNTINCLLTCMYYTNIISKNGENSI